jgi:VanZ family protein
LTLGLLLVAGVVVGSLLPGNDLPMILQRDKIVHAGSYFLLMVWFAGIYEPRRHLVVAVVLAVLGFTLDAMQGGIATRSFDLRDVAANVAGVAIGLVLSRWLFAGWCLRVERLLAA